MKLGGNYPEDYPEIDTETISDFTVFEGSSLGGKRGNCETHFGNYRRWCEIQPKTTAGYGASVRLADFRNQQAEREEGRK